MRRATLSPTVTELGGAGGGGLEEARDVEAIDERVVGADGGGDLVVSIGSLDEPPPDDTWDTVTA